MDRSCYQDLAVDLLRASGAFYRDDASYPTHHAPLPPSASTSVAAAELAAAAQEEMAADIRGPHSRQHFAVATVRPAAIYLAADLDLAGRPESSAI